MHYDHITHNYQNDTIKYDMIYDSSPLMPQAIFAHKRAVYHHS